MISWWKEEFMCLSSLVKFQNNAVIKGIQEDQFNHVIWSVKVSWIRSENVQMKITGMWTPVIHNYLC